MLLNHTGGRQRNYFLAGFVSAATGPPIFIHDLKSVQVRQGFPLLSTGPELWPEAPRRPPWDSPRSIWRETSTIYYEIFTIIKYQCRLTLVQITNLNFSYYKPNLARPNLTALSGAMFSEPLGQRLSHGDSTAAFGNMAGDRSEFKNCR